MPFLTSQCLRGLAALHQRSRHTSIASVGHHGSVLNAVVVPGALPVPAAACASTLTSPSKQADEAQLKEKNQSGSTNPEPGGQCAASAPSWSAAPGVTGALSGHGPQAPTAPAADARKAESRESNASTGSSSGAADRAADAVASGLSGMHPRMIKLLQSGAPSLRAGSMQPAGRKHGACAWHCTAACMHG